MRRHFSPLYSMLTKSGLFANRRKMSNRVKRVTRRPRFEVLEGRQMLAITVDLYIDEFDGNTSPGNISLREAISMATPGETIDFAGMSSDDRLITLQLGEMTIDKSLTIDASNLNSLTIDANDTNPGVTGTGTRIFNILDSTNGLSPPLVVLDSLTLTGGDPSDSIENDGGAIRSAGLLQVRNSFIQGNEVEERGGAIFVQVAGAGNREVLRIENSVIDDNTADEGGGIAIVAGDPSLPTTDTILITNNTTVSNNTATVDGGGMFAELFGGKLEVSESSFEQNEANRGGGLYFELNGDNVENIVAEVDILDSAFNLNTAIDISDGQNVLRGFGGAIGGLVHKDADVVLTNSLVTKNDAFDGGGIHLLMGDPIVSNNYGEFHRLAPNTTFTMTRSKVEMNEAINRGGGVFTNIGADGEVFIQESTITGNKAGLDLLGAGNQYENKNTGGGIYTYLFSGDDGFDEFDPMKTTNGVAELTIANSTIDHNEAGTHGGGIFVCAKRQDYTETVRSQASIYNSTLSGNVAGLADDPRTPTGPADPVTGAGGGIHIAIFEYDDLQEDEGIDFVITNTTITENKATIGGGVFSFVPTEVPASDVDLRVTNSILSGNTDHENEPNNFYGSINTAETQFNLFGVDDTAPTVLANRFFHHATHFEVTFASLGSGNINTFGNDPLLAPLAFNGGPTRTHAPLDDSPVLDAGSNTLAVIPFTMTMLTSDQRGTGFERKLDVPGEGPPGQENDEIVDIGAHEVGLARVVNVTISGSESDHDPFSFNDPNDNENDFDGSGIQLRTVPVGGADTVTVKFSEAMDATSISAGSLRLTGLRSAFVQTLDSGGFTPDPDNQEYRWKFAAPFEADQYLISLTDAVMDDFGRALDGEWTNPFSVTTNHLDVSEFPSGNDVAGGDFNFVFTILPGDGNLTNSVDGSDTFVWLRNQGGPGHTFIQADFNGDGYTDSVDNAIRSSNYGVDLFTIFVAADFNGDGDVDYDDYTEWSQNYGMGTTHEEGDADLDGDVDSNDFLVLLRQYGLEIDWVV